jgi:HEAT repeat protein
MDGLEERLDRIESPDRAAVCTSVHGSNIRQAALRSFPLIGPVLIEHGPILPLRYRRSVGQECTALLTGAVGKTGTMCRWRRSRPAINPIEEIGSPPTVLSSIVTSLDKGSDLLSVLDWSEWRAFEADLRARSMTAPDWIPGWWGIDVGAVPDYCRLSATPELSAAILTMHSSGHVREAAIRALRQLNTAGAIPALVLRATDWVPQVRSLAIEGLDRLRAGLGPRPFHGALPLMEPPRRSVRARGTYLDELRSWVLTKSETADLVQLLTHSDTKVRQAAARALAETGSAASGLAAALEQSDAATASIIIDGLTNDDWQQPGVLDSALDSKFSRANTAALAQLQSTDPVLAVEVSQRALMSRSPTTRFLAQHFLRKQGTDLRLLYQTALPSRPDVALAGLGEVGESTDVELVEPYLDATLPRVRAAAVTALQRLGGRAAEGRLAAMLADSSPRVTRAASWALIRLGPTTETIEQAWEIAGSNSSPGARNAAFRLFASAGRWSALRIVCRAVVSTDTDLQALGHELLATCLASWNRGIVPSPLRRRQNEMNSSRRCRRPRWSSIRRRSICCSSPSGRTSPYTVRRRSRRHRIDCITSRIQSEGSVPDFVVATASAGESPGSLAQGPRRGWRS